MKNTEKMDDEATGVRRDSPWRKKVLKLAITSFLVGLIGLIFVGMTKSPSQGPVIIMAFLLLVFIFSVSSVALIIQTASAILRKKPVRTPKLLYASFLIGLGIVFLTGLQTLGQLQLIDVVLVALFELLLNFYFLRRF